MQDQLGSTNVKYLTALDQEHHIFLEQWHKEYPQAKIIAPETLPALREKQGYPNFPENWRLIKAAERKAAEGIKIDERFDAEFDVEYVDAQKRHRLFSNNGNLPLGSTFNVLVSSEQIEDCTSGELFRDSFDGS